MKNVSKKVKVLLMACALVGMTIALGVAALADVVDPPGGIVMPMTLAGVVDPPGGSPIRG